MLFQSALEPIGIVPGEQNFRRPCSQDHGSTHGGVQCFEVIHAHTCKVGSQLDIDVARDVHRLKVGVVLNEGQTSVEILRLGNDIFHCLQFGHVVSSLIGHFQIGVTHTQARGFVLCNSPANAAFSPVVSCQSQMPITKHAVELLQVIECSSG